MPFINGKKLSEHLDNFPLNKQKQICTQTGESIAKLHDNDIIHGDLTTSNMIFVEDLPAHQSSQIDGDYVKEKQNKKIIPLTNKKLLCGGGGVELDKSKSNFKIYFIDFGLGFISRKIEDKAVDLHLLKQALEAKHFKNWEILFENVIEGYKKYPKYKEALERLKAVEKRGRYKEKF